MAHEEGHKLSFEEAMAILDRHAAEDAAKANAAPKKKNVTKVKDLLKEGAKARSGLGSAKRQMDLLDKEGY